MDTQSFASLDWIVPTFELEPIDCPADPSQQRTISLREFQKKLAIIVVRANACENVARSGVDFAHDADLMILFFSALGGADGVYPEISASL